MKLRDQATYIWKTNFVSESYHLDFTVLVVYVLKSFSFNCWPTCAVYFNIRFAFFPSTVWYIIIRKDGEDTYDSLHMIKKN